jgi:3-oxoacyl-[acyl-carrier protein] reductase
MLRDTQSYLEGRVAIVTGGSRGIGRAVALRLAAAGARVAVNYRSGAAAADDVVREIGELGGKAIAVGADVALPEDANRLVQQTIAELGGLDVLVNNAGIARDGLIFNLVEADWLDVMRTNFGGTFNCTKAAMGHFMGQRAGAIINVSSVMGEAGWVGESNYAASKAAINAFTRCSALELARFGVRVNAVLPGFTPTDLVGGLLAKDGGRAIKQQIPVREFAGPDQIADVVAFLAGPDSAYMTGSLVRVDGGAGAALGLGRAKL